MSNVPNYPIREASIVTLSLLSWQFASFSADANPQGGTVTQGSGVIVGQNTANETITTTTANTFINWSSFNIGAADTTTFVEPSATSVVWNNIDSANGASSIMGNLNANGYIILQNASGFQVGGSAAINAGGLVMTTAAVHPPSLSSGGAWEFDAPPPTAQILNFGKINISGGGSAFLIAGDIVNEGTGQISAEGGKVGLYAGEKVLVSLSPDGRGISAKATVPQGSVDNEGRLIADGGSVAIEAQTVNQNGLIQANGVQNINGVVELVAGNDLNIGASSDIEANGDATSANATPGGFVVLQSGNTYEDTLTSVVNVNGQNGGQGGIVEVLGSGNVQSGINGAFATLNNPSYITLSDNPTDTTSDPANPNFNIADLSNYGQINLHALDTIELNASWTLNDLGAPGSLKLSAANNILVDFGAGIDTTSDAANYWNLNLEAVNGNVTYDGSLTMVNGNVSMYAGNNIEIGAAVAPGTSHFGGTTPSALSMNAGNSIILDDGSDIKLGNDWGLNMVAGAGFDPTTSQSTPFAGTDGIYLNGSAYLQTQNSDINLWAANEIQVSDNLTSSDRVGLSGITTQNGGSINAFTEFGDINCGSNPNGYIYNKNKTGPFYTVATPFNTTDGSQLGGISTAAGGNVNIQAGGNIFSYIPAGNSAAAGSDGGTGAFGPQAGNVTITAGGSIYGNYVLANGVGSISAGLDVGASSGSPFALNLINGSWTVNAARNIFLQEIRNPNGIFNTVSSSAPGFHLFDYSPDATLNLNADGVFITGQNLPRRDGVPVLYPPILNINAGAGGVNLEDNVTLFPSPDQSIDINIADGGSLVGQIVNGNPTYLYMSDSSATQWKGHAFSTSDHGASPITLNDPNPVNFNVSGNIEDIDLITSKATQIFVGGDMINAGFSGENLHGNDTTTVQVDGQIFYQSAFTFAGGVTIPSISPSDFPIGYASSWNSVFTLAVDPTALANLQVPPNIAPSQLAAYILGRVSVFGDQVQKGVLTGANPGFVYNASTGQLGFDGPMDQTTLQLLSGPITVLHLVNGVPVIDPKTGQFETDTYTWAPASVLQTLYANSQNDPVDTNPQMGLAVGGPGVFKVNAGSISLGNSYGILTSGVEDTSGLGRFSNLAALTPVGADLDVTAENDVTMQTSTIAALGGGDVNLTSNGSMDLGSPELFNQFRSVGYGVFSSGGGDVNVIADGDINIDGSRIATYNGGNIFVESLTGNVDVGTGGNTQTGVLYNYVDPVTGKATQYSEFVFGNGIVANTLVPPTTGGAYPPGKLAAAVPGNITVYTPQGNITASLGGITQQALNGSTAAGPVINLTAGTPAANGSPGFTGNIDLGKSGVIGGTVDITANGNVTGLIISRQNSNVNAAQNFNGSVLAGGSADVSGGGSVSGVIVGVGGASVSGGSVSATVLSQNASVNGASSTSTLGSSANATSTSASAANQASNENKELASTDNGEDDNKKKKNQPLMTRVKRVTVILPKT